MTIEQAFFEDTWEVYCDRCSYYEEFQDVYDFSNLIEQMEKKHWKNVKTDTGWEHICETCQDKEAGLI